MTVIFTGSQPKVSSKQCKWNVGLVIGSAACSWCDWSTLMNNLMHMCWDCDTATMVFFLLHMSGCPGHWSVIVNQLLSMADTRFVLWWMLQYNASGWHLLRLTHSGLITGICVGKQGLGWLIFVIRPLPAEKLIYGRMGLSEHNAIRSRRDVVLLYWYNWLCVCWLFRRGTLD